ncbi:chaperone protein DnaK [Candidatus Thiomargarita nelsonii]|uniref:Chaperone protein DnaK n=1 Tax=Candidatus Thiomargarita nelsonii TaxID=1003181 RepID=A0A0A6RJX3_9GAMM|nr:chaperone protein DnaK [Candidatus Thiomargarita nelsonii]
MNNQFKKVFGIDLGTTYSGIAYIDEHGKPVIVPNAENQRLTPSVVFFDGDNIIVGEVAKENAKLYPNEVVTLVKRSMGEPNFLFEYQEKNYRPEEISGYILRKLVNDAKQHLGEEITDVVITCPAYFGINEREATRLAGEIAGLQVRQILNEPTAAAIAYGTVENDNEKVVLVYDLGGGTFDITMIHVKPDAIEVICTGGDKELGGKDWDDRIIQHLVEQFQAQTGSQEDILDDHDTLQELQLSAEKAKKTLSQREKAPIIVTHSGERAKIELTRDKFDEITQDLLERTMSLTQDMLAEAQKKGYNSFDEFLLVGGSTRMPQIMARVEQAFPTVKPKIFDPDEAVAKGAALYGWKLSINDELVRRVTERTGKLEKDKIEIPEEIAQSVAADTGFTLEAVKSANMAIRNVTSKSFGVVALNQDKKKEVVNLILKNTTVPAEVTERFGTELANQDTVEIRIMENEVSDNKLEPEQAIEIGTASLELPSLLPANSPIDISFRLNEEGRLEMTAVEITDDRKISVSIETSSVIQGEELEEAKARNQNLVIS